MVGNENILFNRLRKEDILWTLFINNIFCHILCKLKHIDKNKFQSKKQMISGLFTRKIDCYLYLELIQNDLIFFKFQIL